MVICDTTIKKSCEVVCSSSPSSSNSQVNMAYTLPHVRPWIIDSGASEHITCSDMNLFNITRHTSESSVRIPNGESIPVNAVGSLYLPNGILLERVLYIPKFQCNLLSVSRLTSDLNCTLIFFPDFCILQNVSSKKLIGVGKLCDGLYYLEPPRSEGVAMSVSITPDLWHQRLGHASDGKLHHISSLKGFRRSNNFCDPCIRAKQTRLPFPTSSIKTTRCFELIHCDIWGGYRCDSISGARYFLSIVDDFTRGVWVYLMKNKSEVSQFIMHFCNMIETQFEQKVKRIRADNGVEFKTNSLLDYYGRTGILLETSCTDTPQQNGVVERKHRHILEIARALRFQSGLPIDFWGECILTAVYIINRLPSPIISNKSPFEMLFGKVPSYDHLRVFGCLVYAHDNKRKDKFAERGSPCIFIGYPHGQKAYRVFDLQKHNVYSSRDVTFCEEIFPFKLNLDQELDFPSLVEKVYNHTVNNGHFTPHHNASSSNFLPHPIITSGQDTGQSTCGPTSGLLRDNLPPSGLLPTHHVPGQPHQLDQQSDCRSAELTQQLHVDFDLPTTGQLPMGHVSRQKQTATRESASRLHMENSPTPAASTNISHNSLPKEQLPYTDQMQRFSPPSPTRESTRHGPTSENIDDLQVEDTIPATIQSPSQLPLNVSAQGTSPTGPSMRSSNIAPPLEQRRGDRNRRMPKYLDHYETDLPSSLDHSKSATNAAVRDPLWRDAMQKEINALEENNTWVLVSLPPGKKAIDSKWVYKIKYKSNGDVERYKARLVARGFTQVEGVDFHETFAPVAKLVTVRCLLAVAAKRDWTVHQLDVNNAFLHGDLSEDVYMRLPQGFAKKDDTRVCKLQKSLYGLRQASRNWYHKFTQALVGIGFRQSRADHSLFIFQKGLVHTFALIYVDDVILAGNDSSHIDSIKHYLDTKFSIKDLGKLKYFLGIEVARSPEGFVLSQRKYTLDILDESGNLAGRPSLFPMEQNLKLRPDDGSPLVDAPSYRRLIGRLLYLTVTRPDIVYSVSQLSQFLGAPRQSHFDAAIRVLRYLKSTPGQGIFLSSDHDFTLTGYCDADWAGCSFTRRSSTGYLITIGASPISWRTKKQSVVSRSSAEAEYRAMAVTVSEILWLRWLLRDLTIYQKGPTLLYCDNQAARHIALNPVFHERTKHVEMDCHFVRERVASNEIQPQYISTTNQVADIFTKALGTDRFHFLRSKLGVRDLHTPP
ncbi:unnamed protein product [Cuscuta epithymum]|uniref:Integrase catalytic domain-containing protein n=1 Tax=Cuscuta epithymum TaxID=186058 RepID=A0AAV0G2A0_9ASTE|nr:unnamed protein product [Cuscuta epithymum]